MKSLALRPRTDLWTFKTRQNLTVCNTWSYIPILMSPMQEKMQYCRTPANSKDSRDDLAAQPIENQTHNATEDRTQTELNFDTMGFCNSSSCKDIPVI